jgi:hypothetical protein
MLAVVLILAATLQAPPAPQPFPRPGTPPVQAPSRPAQPAVPPPASQPAVAPPPSSPASPASGGGDAQPSEAMLGVPVYPGAQFIASYNAGRNQRYYLYGSGASFGELVTYYRTLLKQKGDLVYEVPATQEFDIGRFDNNTMAFPPGVTIKDFQSDVSRGFPNPKAGAEPARFPTIIQIVPVAAKP